MQDEESLIPFRRFDSWQNTQQFVEILEKMGIEYKLEEYDKNPVVLGSLLTEKEFLIKVRRDDFEDADKLILQATEINIQDIDPNHYLFGFTDEELIEILVKPNEWGEIDRILAQKLLIDREYDIDSLDIENKSKKYAEQLAKEQEQEEIDGKKIFKRRIIRTILSLFFTDSFTILLLLFITTLLFTCKPKPKTESNESQSETLSIVDTVPCIELDEPQSEIISSEDSVSQEKTNDFRQEKTSDYFYDKSTSSFEIFSEGVDAGLGYRKVEVYYKEVFLIPDGYENGKYLAKYTKTTEQFTGMDVPYKSNIKVEVYPFEKFPKLLLKIDKNCDVLEFCRFLYSHSDSYKTTIYGCCAIENTHEIFDFKHKSIIQADKQVILGTIPNSNFIFYVGFKKEDGNNLCLGSLNYAYNSEEKYAVKIRTRDSLRYNDNSPDIEILSNGKNDGKFGDDYVLWSLNQINKKSSISNIAIRLTYPSIPFIGNNLDSVVFDIPIINGVPFGKEETNQEIYIEGYK